MSSRTSGKSPISCPAGLARSRRHSGHSRPIRFTSFLPLMTQNCCLKWASAQSVPQCFKWRWQILMILRVSGCFAGRIIGCLFSYGTGSLSIRPPTRSSPSFPRNGNNRKWEFLTSFVFWIFLISLLNSYSWANFTRIMCCSGVIVSHRNGRAVRFPNRMNSLA